VSVSIRLRLALWYGLLAAALLTVVSFLAYSSYARDQYRVLDRVLVLSANHVSAGVRANGRSYVLDADPSSINIVLRLYGPDSQLRQASPNGRELPATRPADALERPAGPAYSRLVALVPALTRDPPIPDNAAFGIISITGERWRRYVVELARGDMPLGYVEAITPLAGVDDAVASLAERLLLLDLVFAAVVVALAWALAGSALAPLARLTSVARAIKRSQDLGKRVEGAQQRDELGRLAETFNEMLASLEAASRTQQRFIADASHELRAPLTAMQGNLELLRRFPDMAPDDRAEALRDAEREAGRLSRLVADLLTLARSDAGTALRSDTVSLDEVVSDVVREWRQAAGDRELACGEVQAVHVDGDEDRLRQVLVILVDNAIKYTPTGARITVELVREGTDAELRVTDTGRGLPPEDLERVFERFYRADPARPRDAGGSGLGLAIARSIVEAHGGRIRLDSRPGHGTTALVRLPLSHTAGNQPRLSRTPHDKAGSKAAGGRTGRENAV
jgi:two-component system OmpR family sensor kinase